LLSPIAGFLFYQGACFPFYAFPSFSLDGLTEGSLFVTALGLPLRTPRLFFSFCSQPLSYFPFYSFARLPFYQDAGFLRHALAGLPPYAFPGLFLDDLTEGSLFVTAPGLPFRTHCLFFSFCGQPLSYLPFYSFARLPFDPLHAHGLGLTSRRVLLLHLPFPRGLGR
jgi:hypothetical protein